MAEFEYWQSVYVDYLKQMYVIFQTEAERNNIKFRKQPTFEEFCKFIYSQSSRYYSNYA